MTEPSAHPTNPRVLMPGEGPVHPFLGVQTTIKLADDQTGGAFHIVEAEFAPGAAIVPHVHESVDEAYYILSGILTIYIDDRRIEAPAGACVYVPRGHVHCQRNEHDRPARMLELTLPGWGIERFVREAAGITSAEADGAALASLAFRYGIRPPPAPPPADPT